MNYEEYLDQETESVKVYEGPQVSFSHIEANDEGLRDYQQDMKHQVYDKWDTTNNIMLQMPTGTGKTIVFTSIVRDIQNWCIRHQEPAKILIIAHRRELIEQASQKLKDIPHGIIQSGTHMDLRYRVQVASIQTFMSRRNYNLMSTINFGFIIIDEAHHSLASGYQKLWEMYPNSKKLGVTATPWRMNHAGFTDLYGDLILSKSIEWFVNHGYLSNYDYVSIRRDSETQKIINGINKFGVDGDYLESELSNVFDTDHIRARLYESYKKHAAGKKGIIYAIDRQHAANICDMYRVNGIEACVIDGTTPSAERTSLIESFRAGTIKIIVNVNIFSEGFDCPDIEFIQLARPTRSLAMYLQQVGRGLRVSKNKEHTIILDNVGLYNRFGTPMANRKWKHHFIGSDPTDEGYNDGTGILRDVVFEDREPDYSEGNEEMVVIEHSEGKEQIRPDSANDAAKLGDYNVFRQNGLYGVCDKHNRTIIPPIYEEMHPYCNGYIPYKQKGKWGIMLRNGVVKVMPKYYYIGPFIDGIAEVRNTEDSPKYFINDKLERVE